MWIFWTYYPYYEVLHRMTFARSSFVVRVAEAACYWFWLIYTGCRRYARALVQIFCTATPLWEMHCRMAFHLSLSSAMEWKRHEAWSDRAAKVFVFLLRIPHLHGCPLRSAPLHSTPLHTHTVYGIANTSRAESLHTCVQSPSMSLSLSILIILASCS